MLDSGENSGDFVMQFDNKPTNKGKSQLNTNSLKIKPTIGSGSNLLEKTLDVGIYPYIGVTEGTPTGAWDAGTVIVLPQGSYKVRLAINGSGTYVSTYQPGVTYGTWVKQ